MNFNTLFQLAADKQTTSSSNAGGSIWMWVIYFAIIIGAFYFILIRPQRKKQKEEEQMKNNTQVGDEILSIGGIYGKIVAVKEDSYIVESGPDRAKVRVAKWAIQQNFTAHETEKEVAGKTEKKKLFGKKKDSAEENAKVEDKSKTEGK